jgi:ABC-2 type transport system ATP-binding protein
MELIRTHDLTKQFDGFTAVDAVTLSVAAGEILALLGPNGAGKTTTIRMLTSILRPTRGTAEVGGFDTQRNPVEVRRNVGLLTEHHGLYTRMRPMDYLQFFGRVYGMTPERIEARVWELAGRYDLEWTFGRRLGEFSKGMRQKLALVRALLHDPPVLLLDEPTSAMDPSSARTVREGIVGLRSAQRAIVVCTHNLPEAEMLADRIAIIHRGRIVVHGTPNELKKLLLGDPIMELRLAQSLDGAVGLLPPGIDLLASGPDWIRYRTSEPQTVNPRLLGALAAAGVPVVTLSEVHRSLEDVYLQVVEGQQAVRPAGADGERLP